MKTRKNTEACGSFGGLKETDIPVHKTTDRPQGRLEFSPAESFFLAYMDVSWPVSKEALDALKKQALFESHPDKSMYPQLAQHRFILLSSGANELSKRLLTR